MVLREMKWTSFVLVLLVAGCGGEPEPDGGPAPVDANRPDGAASVCSPACETGTVCIAGTCIESVCGDGVVNTAAGEECDDGNDIAFDGCDSPGCTFTCDDNATCDDSEPCNGQEICTDAHICEAGEMMAEEAACESPSMTGLCRAGMCVTEGCGNGFVEGTEACDDMNMVAGDGCELDCTFTCTVNTDCDDEDFCNGDEVCVVATHTCANAGARDCDDSNPCTVDSCVPGACANTLIDNDGDGYASTMLGECGTDCRDNDATINPGRQELCDAIDHDCDGSALPVATPFWYVDCDGDDYAATGAISMQVCEEPAVSTCGGGWTVTLPAGADVDCDDTSAGSAPRATEVVGDADDTDENCDGAVTCFVDMDGDGVRTDVEMTSADGDCTDVGEARASAPVGDCDDTRATVRPGATEIPGDVGDLDENCDGVVSCFANADGDAYRTSATVVSSDADCGDAGEARASVPAGDCNDSSSAIHPGATEIPGDAGNVDEDCNGTRLCYANADGDAYRTGATVTSTDADCTDAGEAYASLPTGDCDDTNPAIRPNATESPGDGVDQNCDSSEICYVDGDSDGYRLTTTVSSPNLSCGDDGEALATEPTGDCNDGNAAIRPGATELPGDEVDQNCDGAETCYRDVDGDGYRTTGTTGSANVSCRDAGEGLASDPTGDCDDGNGAVHPTAAEIPGDEIDQDCDSREICYVDGDNDTYRLTTTVTSANVSCGDPGEARAAELTGDCDDGNGAIRPNATEGPGDEVDQNCDGAEICFVDSDNDDYRTTAQVDSANTSCGDSGEARASQGMDCNDGNATIYPGAPEIPGDEVDQSCDGTELCFRDGDNDGYRLTVTVSSPDVSCAQFGEAPASDPTGDCDDTDARAFPGQTMYFTTARNGGGYDFSCDGVSTRRYTGLHSSGCNCFCMVGFCCAGQCAGWLSSVPACGSSATWRQCDCEGVRVNSTRPQECR